MSGLFEWDIMEMKVSVILATARLGGLDMIFESLAAQSMAQDDFELIIVDDWHERRWRETLQKNPLRFFRHIPPKDTGVSYHNSASFNTGLAMARGELVIHLVDFVWLPRNFLDYHWDFYKEHPGYSLSVYVDRYKYLPIAHPSYPLGIFERWFDREFAEYWFKKENLIYEERKGGMIGIEVPPYKTVRHVFEMPGDKIYMLGDSIPLAVMKELNGWDQIYDSGYGSNDVDIGIRANMIGWKFAVDLAAPILKKLGDKSTAHLLPTIKTEFIRTPEDNYRIFQERIKAIQEGRESVRVPEGKGAWQ